ncbi:MAG: ATP-binding protein [Leptospiraceae bacterium]|nr:ATP-binding protein [Leptospiraceae bacterium]
MNRNEILILIGPRQIGKTTQLLELESYLKVKGMNTIFFNLDFESDKKYFESQAILLSKIELELGKNKGYVIIDEVQRKENVGLFLKGIYDKQLPYKWIVSGSGSLELKEKIQESLSGRKRMYELNPVNFLEFFHYKTEYKYKNKEKQFFEIDVETRDLLFKEYLCFGGFPRIILDETIQEKRRSMEEIYTSYMDRDIRDLGISKTREFSEMFQILASQSGKILNYNELSNSLNLSLQTTKQYLWYAEKTFQIDFSYPYFQNKRKELTKSPIVYFRDIGFLNFSSGNFHIDLKTSDLGFIFQNFIFQYLRDKYRYENVSLHYWRTKDGAEVDIIMKTPKEIIPIEIKYKHYKKPELSRGFRSFLTHYQPHKALIINLNYSHIIDIESTSVEFIPWYKMLTNAEI